MANRSWESEALVLSLREFGEGNRSACLLLPEFGDGCKIENATVYGGPKSKLRGVVVPYHTGRIWLYSNPIKKTTKINDFKVKEYRSGIRDNLTRLWSASVASEIALKFEGNIDWKLINFFLDGISCSTESQCATALLRFIWRVIIFSGVAPDVTSCAYCEQKINFDVINNNKSSIKKDFFYIPIENNIVCSSCFHGDTQSTFRLSEESCLYLFAIQNLIPKISRNFILTERSYSELKEFLFYLVQSITNKPLKTLQSGNIIF